MRLEASPTHRRRRDRRWRAARLALALAFVGVAVAGSAQAQEKPLDQLLDLSLDDLMKLRIVSTQTQARNRDLVPATVRIITADEIREHGYLTLEDALADLPGFQFRNIEGFNSYVFMRGVPSQNNTILLLVDGIQINELNSGGFYAGGQFNLANVQQIEVLYGPASAMYGTNAVSGIINLITRAPESAEGGKVNAAVGTFDTGLVDVRYGAHAPDGRSGFVLAGMYKHSDKANLRGREGDGNWTNAVDTFETDMALDGRFRVGAFTGGFNLQDKNASRATVQKTAGFPLSDHGVNWHIRFANLWAAYTYDSRPTWSLRSTVYLRDSTVLRDSTPIIELPTGSSPGLQERTYRPGRLIGSETRLQWTPSSRLSASVGLVLERERLSQTFSTSESNSATEWPPAPPSPLRTADHLVSVYAQAQLPLWKSLDLFLGIRHDDSSFYGTVNTPRAGLVFNRGRFTAKALYMEAFRAPKPWDFTDGLGNPGLEPETMRSHELSGAWSFSAALRLELSVYHNRLDGLLTRSTEVGGWRWINAGELETDGAEAALEYRRGALKTYFNYSYTASQDRSGARVPEISLTGANAGITYSFSRAVVGDLRVRYRGPRKNPSVIPATGDTRIDGSTVLYGALSVELAHGLSMQLVVDNLTNEVYFDPSNLPPSRYRQPQRSFRLRMGYAF